MKQTNKYAIYIYTLIFITLVLLVLFNYKKIPSKEEHINRNKYNVMPVGKLTKINSDNVSDNDNDNNNKYIDDNNIIWIRRSFIKSLAHNPFENYVFETYVSENSSVVSSSEVETNKIDFDNGKQHFRPASYNYYSSFRYPISHFFSDMVPSYIYLFPDYNKFQ